MHAATSLIPNAA